MRDALHDKIDDREALSDEARAIVDGVKQRLRAAIKSAGPGNIQAAVEEAMAASIVAVADELAPLTTRAVHTGARNARKVLSRRVKR